MLQNDRMQFVVACLTLCLLFVGSAAHAGNNAWTRIGPPGGAVTALEFDPADPSVVVALAGEVVISRDGGTTWSTAYSAGSTVRGRLLAFSRGRIYVVTDDGRLFVSPDAPDFTLEDPAGKQVSLSQFRGQKMVLIEFIGAVFAPTCSANVHDRAIHHEKFKDADIQVIGISSDNKFALKAYTDSERTPFPLLADPRLQTIKRYGVLAPDKFRALRAYFLVDKAGILRRQWLLGTPGDDMVFTSDPIFAAVQEFAVKR